MSISMLRAGAALFLALAAGAVHASDRASSGLNLSMTVPLVCKVEVLDTRATDSGTVTRLKEFCNNPRGFRVWMAMTGLDDGTRILYDGKPVRRLGDRLLLIDALGGRNRETEIEVIATGPMTAELSLQLEAIAH